MRRSPPPWTVEAIDGGFKIKDANAQAIAYVYGHADKRDAETAKGLTLDEARRIGANIAKQPKLLGQALNENRTSSLFPKLLNGSEPTSSARRVVL